MGKHYKPAFRQEVAELVVDKGYSITEACEAMSVGKSSLDKWVRQLKQDRAGQEHAAMPISQDQRRIKELESENQRLKLEKEILKKATALLMSDEMNGLR